MASFEFVEWLLAWLEESESFIFDWDEGKQEKNKEKHGIEVKEIEEVFYARHMILPLGIQIFPRIEEERLGIIGPSKTGKILHIVFTIREGHVRPISARPAHKKERELYEKGIC